MPGEGDDLAAVVTFTDPVAHPYEVRVTVVGLEHPVVTEIAVERPEGVSPRDVRRLPLSMYAQAAVVAWRDWDLDQAAEVLTAPRGRPRGSRSVGFYRDLADFYRSLVRAGVRYPAKEIARRKHVDQNTVHQWVYRARELGFLERLPRTDAHVDPPKRRGKR